MTWVRQRLHRHRAHHGPDSGLSLMELLVSSMVLVVVLPTAGALLYAGLVSQRDVGSISRATTSAQTVVSSVEAGVRNAAALRYIRSGTDGADELLVVRTVVGPLGQSTWTCRAWFYRAATHTLYTRSTRVTATTTAITTPTVPQLASWSVLAQPALPPAGAHLFTPSADLVRVDVVLAVPTETVTGTTITTSVARRPQEQTGGAPCF